MTLQPRRASEVASCDPYAVAVRDPAARSCPWDGRSKGVGGPMEARSDGHQGLPGGHHLVTERGRGTVPTRTCSRLIGRPAWIWRRRLRRYGSGRSARALARQHELGLRDAGLGHGWVANPDAAAPLAPSCCGIASDGVAARSVIY